MGIFSIFSSDKKKKAKENKQTPETNTAVKELPKIEYEPYAPKQQNGDGSKTSFNENEVILTSYTSKENPVVLPREVDGKTVVALGKGVIWDCFFTEEIIIPDSVRVIEDEAFAVSLFKSITIPEGVTYIGEEAFRDCADLQTVTFPSSLTIIGQNAFGDCDIKDIYISDVKSWLNVSFMDDEPRICGKKHFLDADGNEITELDIPAGGRHR